MAIGDFDSITSSEEKIGGRAVNRKAMQDFNTCFAKCELMQAHKTGLQHSWSNCQHDWGYKLGLRIASDHAPLLGGSVNIPKPKNIPWKFHKMWLSHSSFMEVVSQSWSEEVIGDPAFGFQQKLKKLRNILKDWNWNVFGNVHLKLKEVEEEVQKAMLLSDLNPADTEALDNLVVAENNFNSKEVHLSTMLKQKDRTKWVKEGSANTGFFHANFKIRQSRNFISELQDENGDITTDQSNIASTLVQHFQQKFQFKEVEQVDCLLEVIPKVITEDDQQMLDVIPNEKEIKKNNF
ncbi:uncharacterized protein LOC113271989 [Papaver somniferum]|uniref:uncharacterized protein LOC113271989 n=1 Tax=Papaver somniferum TaxID=3469 RepID=UPI000E6F5B39|nr:uncharacterized protein LOC113271989 [Papaver somniferum]